MDHQCWCCCTYHMLRSFGFVVGLHSYSTVVVGVLGDLVVHPNLDKNQEHCCNCRAAVVVKLPNLDNLMKITIIRKTVYFNKIQKFTRHWSTQRHVQWWASHLTIWTLHQVHWSTMMWSPVVAVIAHFTISAQGVVNAISTGTITRFGFLDFNLLKIDLYLVYCLLFQLQIISISS